MAEYVRTSGGHVAERVRPEPDSPHEAELERLATDPATNWRKVDDQPHTTATSTGMFDPSTRDVPQVLAYLDDAGAQEASRVLDAEEAGKNRKGIVDLRAKILAREMVADAERAAQNSDPE